MIATIDYTPVGFTAEAVRRAPGIRAKMQHRVLDPLRGLEWDRLVHEHGGGSVFHSSGWARVLSQTYGHQPLYLYFSRNAAPMALVPLMGVQSFVTGRRGVCLPFSDFCDPLYFEGCAPGDIVAGLSEIALERKWKHFEVRARSSAAFTGPASTEYWGHHLNLQRECADLWRGFSSSVRRALRKAEKSHLQLEVTQTWASVTEFYRLHTQTRRQNRLPPQPLSFFQAIFNEIVRRDLGFVVQASLSGRPIASAIFFKFGRMAIYKYGASERTSRDLRANNSVMWEAIRFLSANGCEELHFGRTSLTQTGLRRFKLGWGAAEEKIRYYKWQTATRDWENNSGRAAGWHEAVFARMPLALNRIAGALIYPHLD